MSGDEIFGGCALATGHQHGAPVLLPRLQWPDHSQREQPRPVIQSGSLPRPSAEPAATVPDDVEDPWLHNDPWKAYRKSASVASASRGPTVVASAPRPLAGPTEARFQDQDAKISAEKGLRDMQAQADDRHKAYQEARKEDAQHHRGAVEDLRAELGNLSQDFACQLRTSVDSLQSAQQQQMQQLLGNFADLKSLVSCRDREAKKPRVEGSN